MIDTIIIDGLSFALPLLIIAIGGIYSERSGITNLALEGLQGFGAFSGALFFTLISGSFAAGSNVPIYLSLVVAMLGGAIFSMLHALLCIKFKANQVISGVVINIVAMALTSFLTSQINDTFIGKPSSKFMLNTFPRVTIPYISEIPILGAFFTNFYIFEPIIIVVAAIAWYILYRTRYGMHLRACGDNPQAVDTAGIKVNKTRFTAVMVSGALSGLGGMCFAYSISSSFSVDIYMGAGYLAIAALIFGNWKVIPTLGACLIFGFARSGAFEIVKAAGLPSSYSDLGKTLPYILTLLLLVYFSKKNHAPRALGETYDQSKR